MASESLIPDSHISIVINLAVNEIFNEKVNINKIIKIYPPNTYGVVSPTLKEQFNRLYQNNQGEYNSTMNKLYNICKIIDYVDCVHDFKSCNESIRKVLNIAQKQLDLCSAGENINIDKSHIIQDNCVKDMFKILQASNIIVPTLNESFFIPSDKINEYIKSKNYSPKFYLESGRTPNVDDSLIQPKTLGAIYDGCAHSGISYNDAKNESKLASYKRMYNDVVNTNIEDYKITMYGGEVTAIFKPSSMQLAIYMTKDTTKRIIIELINNTGITVNSVLSSFPQLQEIFSKAERGEGNEKQTYRVIYVLPETDPYYIFLATCLKTVCDKVASTEITPKTFINDITTTDGYVWAGVTYKYLIGEYDILPTVYETVKNGWRVRTGIYNINQEISDSIIRVLHLLHLNGVNINLITGFEAFKINSGIIESYKNMLKNHNTVAIYCKEIIDKTYTGNVFDFISSLKILKEYEKITDKLDSLKRNLTEFQNNITPVNLLNIKLLEDVLKNPSVEDAMNNQQTIIFNEDIIYNIDLTPHQKDIITEFINTYKNNITNPATFIRYAPDAIIDINNNCNRALIKNTLHMDDTQVEKVCEDFKDAQEVSISSSVAIAQNSSANTFEMDFVKAIQENLIVVNINEILTQITFTLNTTVLKAFSKTKNTTIDAIVEWFTKNVYFNVYDEEDSVYVVTVYKNDKGRIGASVTGPLEMEIIWILSMTTMSRPLPENKRQTEGLSREQQKEITARTQKVEFHGKLLYSYLKPEYFLDDSYLGIFIQFYLQIINNNINNNNNVSYLTMWQNQGLPLPNFPPQIPILSGGVINTHSRIENTRGNVTLPLESPPEGGDLNRQRCKRKTKKQKKVKTNKRKNKRNKTSKK